MKLRHLVFLTLLTVMMGSQAYAAKYALEKAHTSINFKVRHLFSWTMGTFDDFEGQFIYDPENSDVWTAEATIQSTSLNTRNVHRDKHLRSKDFFEVETYPTLTFKSTKTTDVTEKSAKLHGDLTIRGVTKAVVLDLEIHGVGKDPWGNTLAGFTASTTINRKDFGLNWNETVETGGVLVGEEVKITIEVEGILQN